MQFNQLVVAIWLGVALSHQPSAAQSPLEGTWKIDLGQTSFPVSPQIFLLKKGKYHCESCLPPLTVTADGKDHAVKGSRYFDTIRVTIVDDSTVEEVEKVNGRTVLASRTQVSKSGATALFDSEEHLPPDPVFVKRCLLLKRVGEVKPSRQKHSLSGSWAVAGYADPPGIAAVLRFAVDRDTIAMTTSDADSVHEETSFASLGKYTCLETLTLEGQPVRIERFMVDPARPDQMAIIDHDLLTGITLLLHAVRQSPGGSQ